MNKSQIAAGALLSTALLQVGEANAPDTSSSPTALEDIVVTARRREERAQTTPISVTAVTSAMLERQNIARPSDLTRTVAGLVAVPSIAHDGGAAIFIRGIGATDNALSVDQPVALYRDGIYLGHGTLAGNTNLTTIERVEVLRGPQGTLFGRNTSGGAINLVTRDPQGEFGFDQRLRYGSFDEFLSSTTVDTGELGKTGLSAVASYEHRQRHGYVSAPTRPSNLDPGAIRSETLFVKVRGEWQKLLLNYSYDLFDLHSVTPAFQITKGSSTFVSYFGLSPSYGGTALTISPQRLGTLDSQDRPGGKSPEAKSLTQGHALNAQYSFSDALTLKSITSWRKFDAPTLPFSVGPDGLRGLTVKSPTVPVPVYVQFTGPDKHIQVSQFSEEMQVQGSLGEFNYTGGGFYFSESGSEYTPGGYVVALSPRLGFPLGNLIRYAISNDSKAAYAQLSYKPAWIDDRLELTGGIRHTSDRKRVSENDTRVRSGARTFDNSTWNVSLKYQWNPELMTFVRVGTGVRSGGFNIHAGTGQNFLFLPERAATYEGGIKSQFLDNHVRVNAGVFYTEYRDLQVTTITGGTSGSLAGATYNANATYRGGEVELQVVPAQGLTISGNVGYVDPKYSQIFLVSPGGVLTNYASTAKFPYLAKLTANLGIMYEVPVSFGEFVGNLNYSYLSKRYFGISNIVGQSPANEFIASPAFGLLNGRISLADISVRHMKAEVSFWMDNITDKAYRQAGLDFGSLGFAGNVYGVPRTLGVDVKLKL